MKWTQSNVMCIATVTSHGIHGNLPWGGGREAGLLCPPPPPPAAHCSPAGQRTGGPEEREYIGRGGGRISGTS